MTVLKSGYEGCWLDAKSNPPKEDGFYRIKNSRSERNEPTNLTLFYSKEKGWETNGDIQNIDTINKYFFQKITFGS